LPGRRKSDRKVKEIWILSKGGKRERSRGSHPKMLDNGKEEKMRSPSARSSTTSRTGRLGRGERGQMLTIQRRSLHTKGKGVSEGLKSVARTR